jgi:hypothetical protein
MAGKVGDVIILSAKHGVLGGCSRRAARILSGSAELGHAKEDLSDPPFFMVEADSATLDEEGTLSIRSGKGNRVFRADMWEICEIRRNTPSRGSP